VLERDVIDALYVLEVLPHREIQACTGSDCPLDTLQVEECRVGDDALVDHLLADRAGEEIGKLKTVLLALTPLGCQLGCQTSLRFSHRG